MTGPFGELLRLARARRGVSQQRLAEAAEVSTRHLSWLENGRAQPSRQMVLILGSALELPLHERNRLLGAAGFAPAYLATPLEDDAMGVIREALWLILEGHEPAPAVVLDLGWSVRVANRGFARLHQLLGGEDLPPYTLLPPERVHLVELFFHSYLPRLRNAPEVVAMMLPRLRRDAAYDERLAQRLEAGLAVLPAALPEVAPRLVVPIELEASGQTARLFTTVTSLASPSDLTTEALRVEMLHPGDAPTRSLLWALAGADPPA